MRTTARILIVSVLIVPALVFAQADGTASDGSVAQKPADGSAGQSAPSTPADSVDGTAATGGSAAQSPAQTPTLAPAQPATGGTQSAPAATTTTPRPVSTTPAPSNTTPPPAPTPNPDSALVVPNAFPALESSSTPPTPTPSFPWIPVSVVVALLALVPFGFVLAGRLKKKPTDDGEQNRCFDIEQMMKDKLKELTDVRAMLKEQGIEKGKEMLRDSVSGTKTGDLFVRAEKLEEQLKKLKALYEECKIDIDRYKLKGVLVENSLLDKKILEHLRVIRTRTEGDRVLHDIRISQKQIDDIQRNIVDAKWYFHLWEPGKDAVTVVFKDKIFSVKNSDKASWQPAITHGMQNGIPESEMNFSIDR